MGRKHVKNILKPVIVHLLYIHKYLTTFIVLPLRYYCFKIFYHKIIIMSNFYRFRSMRVTSNDLAFERASQIWKY